ncbi:MAG: hypothetical protein Q8932_08755 [Bacteroidota bacterium]|nr:hypothetical protein [Bacteroidota bacterium]MDP4245923.1 hypothetical protein [Bacteroidota bacterium]MDP4256094.1 hypothetical protein [Bacteroidota bacterium]MDP4260155.1 hypothetical protein [Bacteroidota bacterium]
MKTRIKKELHELIDTCVDKELLKETRDLLQSQARDWWDDLSEVDRNLILESEESYKRGEFIRHEDLMHQLDAKKKTWSGRP